MRLIKKIVLFAAGLLLLIVIATGIYAYLRQEQITGALIKKVNESVNTKISYSDIHITIFESFPNISVRFTDLLVEPSPYYDKSQFRGEDKDTLLYASSLSVAVFMPSLLTGTVAVRSITAKDGKVSLLTDKRGDINYEVFHSKKNSERKNVKLNNITASNIRAVWNNRKTGIRASGTVNDASLGGEIFKTGIYLNTNISALIDSVNIKNNSYRSLPLTANARLRKSASSLSVAKGTFGIADLKFDINGNVNFSSSVLDLSVSGKKINITSLFSLLPEKWKSFTGSFSPAGIIDVRCKIKGPYGSAGKPHFDVTYNLTGGRMSYLSNGFKINNLEFHGGLTNGAGNSAETFQITVDGLSASYGSSKFSGSFMLNNPEKPHIALVLDADLDFNDLNRIIKPGFLHDQKGSVKGSLRMSGTLPDSIKPVAAVSYLKPDIALSFAGYGASFGQDDKTISDVNGFVTIKNDLKADSLFFNFGGQHFMINTCMKNFIPWITGNHGILDITGEISTDRFIASMFARKNVDFITEIRKLLTMFPYDVKAEMKLIADSLVFRDFRASGFSSTFNYRPYVVNFNNVTARSLDGEITGDFMLGRQKEGGYITKIMLDVDSIDITKTFSSFSNFGQHFIMSNNLAGDLTGTITLLAPLDSVLRINKQSLAAEAHLLIEKGKLVDFAPAESLSTYLDLDELKDISFSKLENDLYIKDGIVSIPKMLINSSAVNFTVYGTHGFNNNYSYHVRLLLSEVLSRKARERNRNVSSFGNVQVDGSGKATIPLKIICVNGKTDVSYDFGQAQDNIRNDISLEKQNMKGILNEEYGWYRSDTTKIRQEESKPKFSITWEEGKEQQSPGNEKQEQEEVSESPFKILLKKKKEDQ